MRVTASDLYTRHRPSGCELRVFLRARGVPEAEPSPYEEVLRVLGHRHEAAHLSSLGPYVDLREGDEAHRIDETKRQITGRTPAIYQAALSANYVLAGIACSIRGDPDFLLLENGGYVVRDCKISLRITEDDHPEILRQLELYGWLLEITTGTKPVRLEVLSGRGQMVQVEYDGGTRALEELAAIVALKAASTEPVEPVGWTKCNGCPFHGRCWDAAEGRRDLALIPGVDQSLARALYGRGIRTIADLREAFDVASLSECRKPRGKKEVRVGKAAEAILRSAACLAENRETLIAAPALPNSPSLVMFDLEGLPPQLDELDKVFLWGTQVFGERPSAFKAALAGFGVDGDRAGWQDFLNNAEEVFDRYGDIPFVHWHHYERTKLRTYVDRYGDRNGIAARVEGNLVDLLPITQNSIVLPISSYSLKVVEQYVGFRRRIEEGRGDWAMAKYIEACETENEAARTALMEQVIEYNREDLEATWAVLCWLRERFGR